MQHESWILHVYTHDHAAAFPCTYSLNKLHQNGELLLQVYQYCIYVNYSSELLSQPNPEVLDEA